MSKCAHPHIITYHDAETGQPVQLWACSECGRRFEPLADRHHLGDANKMVDAEPFDTDTRRQLECVISDLKAENAAMRADAERYRWLAAHCRSYDEPYKGGWSIHIQGVVPERHDCEDAMDAAIDTVRGKA